MKKIFFLLVFLCATVSATVGIAETETTHNRGTIEIFGFVFGYDVLDQITRYPLPPPWEERVIEEHLPSVVLKDGRPLRSGGHYTEDGWEYGGGGMRRVHKHRRGNLW